MKTRHNILSQLSLSSGLAVTLAFGVCWPSAAGAADDGKEAQAQHLLHLQRITTQAQAEALKPGDSMSMTCSKCKDVMVQQVTADNAHVKMMTVGEKVKCHGCDGTVEVVATGKGTGKDAEVKHVCSKCGDDAMFCSATKPGSGSMKDMEETKHAQHPLHLQHITTQAQAEALKPGESMSMSCSKCKNVIVQKVTTDNAHVKMMTIGQKHTCAVCGGTVTVVGTGRGEGKNEEVQHVCSKCGDDAMFVCASKPDSGAMKDMEKEKD